MVKLLDDVLPALEGGFYLFFEFSSLFLSDFLDPYLTFFGKDVCVMLLQLHMFNIYYLPIYCPAAGLYSSKYVPSLGIIFHMFLLGCFGGGEC